MKTQKTTVPSIVTNTSAVKAKMEDIVKPAIGVNNIPMRATSFFNNLNRKIIGIVGGDATTHRPIENVVVHENFNYNIGPFGSITKGFSMTVDASVPLEYILPDKLFSTICVVEIADNQPDIYYQQMKEKLGALCVCKNIPSLKKLIRGDGAPPSTSQQTLLVASSTNDGWENNIRRGGVIDVEAWDPFLGAGFVAVFYDDSSGKHFIGVYVPSTPVSEELITLAVEMRDRPTLRFNGPNNRTTVGEFASRPELNHAYQFSVRNALRLAYDASQLLGVRVAYDDDDYFATNLGEAKIAIPSYQSVFNTVDLSWDRRKVTINNRTLSERSSARYGRVATFGGSSLNGLIGMTLSSRTERTELPSLFGRKLHQRTVDTFTNNTSPITLHANQQHFIETGVSIDECCPHHHDSETQKQEKRKFKKMTKRMHHRSDERVLSQQFSSVVMKPIAMYIGCGCGRTKTHDESGNDEGYDSKSTNKYHHTKQTQGK